MMTVMAVQLDRQRGKGGEKQTNPIKLPRLLYVSGKTRTPYPQHHPATASREINRLLKW